MESVRSYLHNMRLYFILAIIIYLLGVSAAFASSVSSVVASGKVGYAGQITDSVRKAATRNMLTTAIKQVLEAAVSNQAQGNDKLEEFIAGRVQKAPEKYIQDYRIIAELKDKKNFQVTGKVNVKRDLLVSDFQNFTPGESTKTEELALVLLVSEYNTKTNDWDYWWKIPPDKKQRLYFTKQLGKELKSRGIFVVNAVGKEKILLQSTSFQTPFITTDAAIQLGLIYRTPFVLIGNIHFNDDLTKKNKFLVASLQLLRTDDGENVAEILEKKKIRSRPRKSTYVEMAKLVAPRIVDEIEKSLRKSSATASNVGSTSENSGGNYIVTVEISNVNNLHPLEVLQKYFSSKESPVTGINSVILEHKKLVMVVSSEVDGTVLAGKIISAFPNEGEFSILSSSEDSVKISSSYSGVL